MGAHWQEFRALTRLGAPLMLAQVFSMSMGAVDTLMTGRYGAVDQAGIALAGIGVMWPLLVLLSGVLQAMTPIVAQLHGAGRTAEVGQEVRHGAWIAVLLSVVAVLALANLGFVIPLFGAEANVVLVADGYMDAVLWGMPAFMLFTVFRSTCEGLGRTRPAMVIGAIGIVANIALNYAFIYGKFGAPELGGVGSGVATAIIFNIELIAILIVVKRPFYRIARIFEGSWRPQPTEYGRFAIIGAPMGLAGFAEMMLFSLVTLMMANFGTVMVSAHGIGMTLNGIGIMIPLGFAMAATIRIGHAVGAGDYRAARIVGETVVRTAFVIAAITAVLLSLFRHEIAAFFTNTSEVSIHAANLILFVAAYLIVDNMQLSAQSALRGYKDTRIPMVLVMITYWGVAWPVAWVFGYGIGDIEGLGGYGLWIGLSTGLVVGAVLMNIRRMHLARNIHKIEQYAAIAPHRSG